MQINKGDNTKKIISGCMLMLALNGLAYCAQTSRLELTDGSVIKAEVISLKNGIYTLNTGALGEIKLEASKIKNIEIANQEVNPADNAIKSKTEQLKQQITNNPGTAKIIAGLATDPQFQEIVKDPEIVNAAKSEDIKALMSNKKFMNLLNHPKVKEIQNELKEKGQ